MNKTYLHIVVYVVKHRFNSHKRTIWIQPCHPMSASWCLPPSVKTIQALVLPLRSHRCCLEHFKGANMTAKDLCHYVFGDINLGRFDMFWVTLEWHRKTASWTRGHSTGRKAFPCQSSFPEIARFRSSGSCKGWQRVILERQGHKVPFKQLLLLPPTAQNVVALLPLQPLDQTSEDFWQPDWLVT